MHEENERKSYNKMETKTPISYFTNFIHNMFLLFHLKMLEHIKETFQ